MFCGYCVTVLYSSLKICIFQKKLDRKVAILKQEGENISIIPGNDSWKVKPAILHFWKAIGSEKKLSIYVFIAFDLYGKGEIGFFLKLWWKNAYLIIVKVCSLKRIIMKQLSLFILLRWLQGSILLCRCFRFVTKCPR